MRILVISLAGIGDTLFATPLLHELRLNYPAAEIDVLVRWSPSRDLLEGNAHVNAIRQKDLAEIGGPASLRYLRGLRKRRYDISLNTFPQSRVEYRLAARLVGARLRVSHSYDHQKWLTPLLVQRTVSPDYSIHCVENNLALLKPAGAWAKLNRHAYEVFLTPADRQWAEDFLVQSQLQDRTLLGIHVGSGGTKNLALRRWPLVGYSQLIRRLCPAHPEMAILLLGGPQEKKDHERLLAEVDRTRVLAPATGNLRQTAALLEKCHLFLSVDTVLMHLAAAMKVAGQIVIETPTWNKTVEPYGRPFVLVPNPAVGGRNLDFYRYDGRGIRGKPEAIVRCMQSVTVDAVEQAVNETLRRAAS